MRPTYRQAIEIIAALNHLGATYHKVVKDSGKDAVFSVPYRFGDKSQSVRSAAARNLRLLKPHAQEHQEMSNGLLNEISEGRGLLNDEEKELIAQYTKAVNQLDRTPIPDEVDLREIPESDLDLASNPIPPSVVASLALIADLAAPKPETPDA